MRSSHLLLWCGFKCFGCLTFVFRYSWSPATASAALGSSAAQTLRGRGPGRAPRRRSGRAAPAGLRNAGPTPHTLFFGSQSLQRLRCLREFQDVLRCGYSANPLGCKALGSGAKKQDGASRVSCKSRTLSRVPETLPCVAKRLGFGIMVTNVCNLSLGRFRR